MPMSQHTIPVMPYNFITLSRYWRSSHHNTIQGLYNPAISMIKLRMERILNPRLMKPAMITS